MDAWAPMAEGWGASAPDYDPDIFSFGSQGPINAELNLRLQPFPLLPAPPNPVAEPGPRIVWNHVQVTFSGRPDAWVVAEWRSGGNPSGTGPLVKAIFSAAELHLQHPNPANSAYLPWGIASVIGSRTDPWPVYLNCLVLSLDPPGSLPAPSTLTGDDLLIRAFLVAHQAEIREEIWPPENQIPPPPPSPVTVQNRSSFRLRVASAGDADADGIPDGFENAFGAAGKLILTEACYLRYALSPSELIGGEPADWVKVYNPTPAAISTADYYLSDQPSPSSIGHRFALPAGTLASGDTLTIYCTGAGRARLAPGDPHLLDTAPFGLQDNGENVYLLQGSAYTEVARLDPPSGAFPTHPLARISFGLRAIGSGPTATKTKGFFAETTDDLVSGINRRFTYSGALAEPLVQNAITGQALPGQTFRTGTFKVQLVPPEVGAGVVYTLNGTEPTGQSAFYDPAHPIEISGTTVLRARSVMQDKLSSAIITRTFIHTPSVVTERLLYGDPVCDPVVAAAYAGSAPIRAGDSSATPPVAGFPAAGGILQQLEARPIIALTWSDKTPITTEGWGVSFEYIDPNHTENYSQENDLARGLGNHPGITNSWAVGLQIQKPSLHLLFRKAFNLQGNSRWKSPVSGGASAVFPGSPVTSFQRLILRDSHSDGWANNGAGGIVGNAHFCKDAYLRETQRDLGGLTGRRRWVHVYLQGRYWGMYDLGEHNGADMVSDHLKAQYPAHAAALAPENITFLNMSTEDAADPVAVAAWQEVIDAAASASAAPTDTSLWAAVTTKLDLNNYIDYLITLEVTAVSDHKTTEIRAWRAPGTAGGVYPLDRKFRMIAWDGDGMELRANFLQPHFLSIDFNSDVTKDLRPHEYLKSHPQYRAAFNGRLGALLTGALSDASILARYRAAAGDVRNTLECEAMRWAGGGFQYQFRGEELLLSWDEYVKEGVADLIPHARFDLEAAARATNLLTP